MDKVLSGIKNIHLIGIGGIGVSGLALLLKDKGFVVRGSDVQDTYNIKMLKRAGIEVYVGHKSENLRPDTDLVCYSSAVKSDNPEILEAIKRGITILPRGKLLGLLCWDKKTIAVSGSHGKTTTTALIGYLLTALGHKPTVFVGGLPLNYERNAWWGQDYFAIETDESDGSFLCYNPWVSVITNIDYEHLDYHKDIESLKKSFLQFAYQTKELVIGCGDDPAVAQILPQVNGLSYGILPHNRVSGANITFEPETHQEGASCSRGYTCFDFFIDKKFISRVKIPLLGTHNVLNTMAVLSFFNYLGDDLANVIDLLKYFKGTKRRFQIKKKVRGVTFVDDYAHHPTEINAVIKAARFLNPKRVFVVFQPHRFSRVKSLYREFSRCFGSADELIVTDIYSASEKEINGINSEFLLNEIKKGFQGNLRYVCRQNLAAEVSGSLEEGDIILGLGAGDINSLMDNIIYEFENTGVKT